jgi:hypothetical protein
MQLYGECAADAYDELTSGTLRKAAGWHCEGHSWRRHGHDEHIVTTRIDFVLDPGDAVKTEGICLPPRKADGDGRPARVLAQFQRCRKWLADDNERLSRGDNYISGSCDYAPEDGVQATAFRPR